jgi:DsbC/DsbD-like thiol-disulfide interchange protein/cytochrome c biogenesis protein CcdA
MPDYVPSTRVRPQWRAFARPLPPHSSLRASLHLSLHPLPHPRARHARHFRATVASLCSAAACLFAATPAAATGAVVTTPQVRAELVAHAPEGIVPGKPLQLGLKIEHQPHWHTYWKNPGDSGLPTRLEWTLPAGVAAGEIEWPAPRRLPIGPLMNYGYEGTLLLPVTVRVPAGFAGQALDVRLRADWLVCKDVCIPEGGDFALSVPTQAATALHAGLFADARAALPRAVAGAQARAEVQDGALVVRVAGLPSDWQGRAIDVFAETAGVLANAARPETRWDGTAWQARVPLDPARSAGPETLPLVLTSAGRAGGLVVAATLSTPWPPLPAPGVAGAAPAAAPMVPATPPLGLGLALALALAGGLLLNLMPCVFPVLSLKLYGFAQHAGERRTLLAGGLAYTLGVVASFVALAALMLALRAGGEQIGWGFQLQSPAFVAALAVLFALIGLNLAGAFEVGRLLPAAWLGARAQHPVVDSLLTGVVAVAVASPCTAPFMGASLGFAVTLPAAEALAVFAALGLGMALPYLAACAWPGLAGRLPRPGPWMAHFRTLMAFPMFAAVVWLVWVLGQQAGIDGAAALLGLLVATAFAAWALGAPALGPRARRGFGLAGVALVAIALAWALPALRHETVVRTATAAERWQPWSAERVRGALAEGRPVFVDFTAAWCVTCQFNKRTVLDDPEVLRAFDARRVLLLRADWTRRDDAISAELARMGRSGVPVYVLHAPGGASPALLSEILTVPEVQRALAVLPG